MIRRPPRSTRTDTRFPYTTLFRSNAVAAVVVAGRLAVELELGVDVAGFDPDEAVIGTVGHGRHRQQRGRQHARRQQDLAHVHSLNREARQWAVEGSSCLSAPSITAVTRSEEHTSEPQSLMRITYDVFCL